MLLCRARLTNAPGSGLTLGLSPLDRLTCHVPTQPSQERLNAVVPTEEWIERFADGHKWALPRRSPMAG